MSLNFVQRFAAHPFRLVAAASLALALAGCGGGGGSPGETTGTPIQPKVASVILMNTSSTIDVAAPGSQVVIDALVRDSNNNVITGVDVNFAASSGTITYTNKTTDALGMSRVTLSTPGELTPREIVVTATAQSVTSAPLKIQVINSTP